MGKTRTEKNKNCRGKWKESIQELVSTLEEACEHGDPRIEVTVTSGKFSDKLAWEFENIEEALEIARLNLK